MNYMRAYRLTELAGCPDIWLYERAEGLKALQHTLWDEDAGWYDFIWDEKREKRYTVQMFKFISSPVIDDHVRSRLVSHLNEREFLSKFGLHSMAKTDPAYDQIDIDNGGGGICMQFTMQIALQLYDAGYDVMATDLLRRVRWIGKRLPYLGDSVAANMLLDRFSLEDVVLCGIRFSVFADGNLFTVVQFNGSEEQCFCGNVGEDKIVLKR